MTLEDALLRYPGAVTYTFGDNKVLCDELLFKVRSGQKTATCGALRDFTTGGEPMPVAGRRDIALNWAENGIITPALITETLDVTIRAFKAVDKHFALAEGENDTLAGWQRDHRLYFTRNGGFAEDMLLVCERFRLIEDFGKPRFPVPSQNS